MDEARAKAVIRHAVQQEQVRKRLRSLCFDKQLEVLNDPSRLKYVLCSRRAGKSYGCGLGLYEAALEKPYVNCLYIGLVRDTARKIMWDPILKKIARDLGLGLTKHNFNETTLTVRLKNHSTITLMGLDKDQEQMDKALGSGNRRIIIDEAASFRTDLKRLVFSYLKPSTADHLGDIWLTGTPGVVRAFFYDVTTAPIENGVTKRPIRGRDDKGEINGWSPHVWNTFDNPHMEKQWKQEIAEILRDRPGYIDTPEYKMMYLGQWFTDDENLCYHYSEGVNGISEKDVPQLDDGVISCDLGFNDDTAFSVNGWNDHDPSLYITHAEKKSKMDFTDVAERFAQLRKQFPYAADRLVVDGANKQGVEEMRKRHSLPLIATEKRAKTDFIGMLDTDLRTGVVKVVSENCELLISEWASLVWDKRAEERLRRKVEHPACPNHLSDTALYGWRHARNFFHSETPARNPSRTGPTDDELNAWAEKLMQKKKAKIRRMKAWGDDWSEDD